MGWRIFHFGFALYGLGVAFLQLNDPDPLVWFTAYGLVTVAAVYAGLGRLPRRGWIALLGAALGGAALVATTAPDWSWGLGSESFRESAGLCLVALWAAASLTLLPPLPRWTRGPSPR